MTQSQCKVGWIVGVVGQIDRKGLDRLMIADYETNVVYVADTLERKFPAVHVGLRTILERQGIPLRVIPRTKDIWCRDYMPIQVAEDRFVQFRYAPNYLGGRYKHLRSDGEIGPTLAVTRNCVRSEIVLDGGNVVRWRDMVIMTERVFAENPQWDRRRLVAEFEELLQVEGILLIPPDPGDLTGHSDGVVRFVDGETVIINDYRRVDEEYRRMVLRRLTDGKLSVRELPYRPVLGLTKGLPSTVGNYVNFLQVASISIVPSYGRREDEEVREILARSNPCSQVVVIPCSGLARLGGVLNCCAWTLKA